MIMRLEKYKNITIGYIETPESKSSFLMLFSITGSREVNQMKTIDKICTD